MSFNLLRYDADTIGNLCVQETADSIRYILFRFNPATDQVTTITSTTEYRIPSLNDLDCSIGTQAEATLLFEDTQPHAGSYFSNPSGLQTFGDAWELAEYERTLIANQTRRDSMSHEPTAMTFLLYADEFSDPIDPESPPIVAADKMLKIIENAIECRATLLEQCRQAHLEGDMKQLYVYARELAVIEDAIATLKNSLSINC